MFIVQRSDHNPLITPKKNHPWEAFATFNGCPIRIGKKTFMIYRGMSEPEYFEGHEIKFSSIGIAQSSDGTHFTKRTQLLAPLEVFDKYGLEDPRVTFFEGKYYIFYTALSTYPFSPSGIRVAIAISSDLQRIDERHLVTPFNAKAMTLFPERIGGKVVALFSAFTDTLPAKTVVVCCDQIQDLWSDAFWSEWLTHIDHHLVDLKRREDDHVEIGAPPIRIPEGWLLVYSHIQHYGRENQVFGVEAVILDSENPQKILKRTRWPFLVPEELYEEQGYVSNIIFPSGALISGSYLTIYYGAADSAIAAATVKLLDLVTSMTPDHKTIAHRFEDNPILKPRSDRAFETKAVFNPAALYLKNKIHLVYRAMDDANTSRLGYAVFSPEHKLLYRSDEPIYRPREIFEEKLGDPRGNSGCEDPRLTVIGDRIYMCYTAVNEREAPRIAVSSIATDDFIDRRWNWSLATLISPSGVDDKDACIITDEASGRFIVFHRIGPNICIDHIDSLDFSSEKLDRSIIVMKPRRGLWDSRKIGIAAPPIKTLDGWLLFYHGVSHDGTYRVGVALLELKDPTSLIARSIDPVLEPETLYEKEGQINSVVFPCGVVLIKDDLYLYYGGGDSVVGTARLSYKTIMRSLLY